MDLTIPQEICDVYLNTFVSARDETVRNMIENDCSVFGDTETMPNTIGLRKEETFLVCDNDFNVTDIQLFREQTNCNDIEAHRFLKNMTEIWLMP